MIEWLSDILGKIFKRGKSSSNRTDSHNVKIFNLINIGNINLAKNTSTQPDKDGQKVTENKEGQAEDIATVSIDHVDKKFKPKDPNNITLKDCHKFVLEQDRELMITITKQGKAGTFAKITDLDIATRSIDDAWTKFVNGELMKAQRMQMENVNKTLRELGIELQFALEEADSDKHK